MKIHFAPYYKNKEETTPHYNSATLLAAPPTATPTPPSLLWNSLSSARCSDGKERNRKGKSERDGVSSRVGGREGGGGVGKAARESRCR